MITAKLIGSSEVIRRFERIYPQQRESLFRAVTRLTVLLSAKVKDEKLSGQVLHRRTGRLSRSINMRITEQSGGIYGSVGTNVEYGKRWEYGYQGPEQVKAHLRMIHKVFGRPVAPHEIEVRAFVRNLNIQPRSFLRSSLGEMRDQIRQELGEALRKSTAEAMKA